MLLSLVATFLGPWWDLWTSGQVANIIPETLPTYTFTGQHLFIDDGNGDWRIKLLSSGVLEWMSPDALLDIFMVGGEASGTPNGGGGGGYTKTQKKYEIKKVQRIQVQVGAGGASGNSSSGNNGGTSSFDTLSVGGGTTSSGHYAGNGGSGGGGSVFNKTSDAGNGGTDGASGGGTYSVGSANQYHTYAGGSGQGTTTREFGDAGAELYSGGGGGLCRHKSGGSVHGSAGSGGSGSPVLAGRGTYKSSSSTSDFFLVVVPVAVMVVAVVLEIAPMQETMEMVAERVPRASSSSETRAHKGV